MTPDCQQRDEAGLTLRQKALPCQYGRYISLSQNMCTPSVAALHSTHRHANEFLESAERLVELTWVGTWLSQTWRASSVTRFLLLAPFAPHKKILLHVAAPLLHCLAPSNTTQAAYITQRVAYSWSDMPAGTILPLAIRALTTRALLLGLCCCALTAGQGRQR